MLGARIVAVADAIAAMSAGRPYREERNSNLVCAELTRCPGTQFDPRVVGAVNSLPEPAMAA
jgi:HD-GYP domain-containing protein (c-di-GMP phosphodiesterase class II)